MAVHVFASEVCVIHWMGIKCAVCNDEGAVKRSFVFFF